MLLINTNTAHKHSDSFNWVNKHQIRVDYDKCYLNGFESSKLAAFTVTKNGYTFGLRTDDIYILRSGKSDVKYKYP